MSPDDAGGAADGEKGPMTTTHLGFDDITSEGELVHLATTDKYIMTFDFMTKWVGRFESRRYNNTRSSSDDVQASISRTIDARLFDDDSFVRTRDNYSSPRSSELYGIFIDLCLRIRRDNVFRESASIERATEINVRIFRKYPLFIEPEGSGQLLLTLAPVKGSDDVFFKCSIYRAKNKPTLLYSSKIADVRDGPGADDPMLFREVSPMYGKYDLDSHVLVTKTLTSHPKKGKGGKELRSAMYVAVDIAREDAGGSPILKYTAYLRVRSELPWKRLRTIEGRATDGMVIDEY